MNAHIVNKTYVIFLVAMIFFGCSDEQEPNSGSFKSDELTAISDSLVPLSKKGKVQIGSPGNINTKGIKYTFKEVTALDYLNRKGEKVAENDVEDLEKESVFMLEFKSKENAKSIKDSPLLQLSENELGQYLVGKVNDDFKIKQGGKTFTPSASLFEGIVGNKIRVSFFLTDIDLSKKFEIEYYDRVFGGGIIKMIKVPNGLIS